MSYQRFARVFICRIFSLDRERHKQMKNGAKQIIGKTITGVVIKRAKGGEIPRSMLFIKFDDGTYYEFYSMHGEILNTGGVAVSGGFAALLQYLQDTHDIDFCAIRSPDSGEVSVRASSR